MQILKNWGRWIRFGTFIWWTCLTHIAETIYRIEPWGKPIGDVPCGKFTFKALGIKKLAMALQFRAAAPISVTSSGTEQGPWTTKLVRCQSTPLQQCRWRPHRISRVPSSFSKIAISCSSVAFSSQSLTNQSAVRRRPNLAVEGKHQGLASVRSSLCGHISLWRKLECSKSQERQSGYGGQARASMRLDPGGGRGPNGGNNGIGRIVFNLALAGGLTYLTVTGKLGWLFDAFISLWVSFSSIYSMAITNTFAAST